MMCLYIFHVSVILVAGYDSYFERKFCFLKVFAKTFLFFHYFFQDSLNESKLMVSYVIRRGYMKIYFHYLIFRICFTTGNEGI